MGQPMRPRDAAQSAPFPFWGYFDALPADELAGHDLSACRVDAVIAEPSGRYEHVIVGSETKNVVLVLVLDLQLRCVCGHHVLDLRREYGLID